MAEVHQVEVVEVAAVEPQTHGAEAKNHEAIRAHARLQDAIANQKELREKTFRVKNRRTGAAKLYPGWWVVSAEVELEALIASSDPLNETVGEIITQLKRMRSAQNLGQLWFLYGSPYEDLEALGSALEPSVYD